MTPGEGKIVVERTWLTTSTKGTPGVGVKGEVTDGLGETGSMTGTIWLSDKAYSMGRAQLKSLGFNIDDQDLLELDNSDLLVGHESPITIVEETYNGNTTIKIGVFGKASHGKPRTDMIAKAQAGLRAAKKSKAEEDMPEDDLPF
jgi:hypothetical protein